VATKEWSNINVKVDANGNYPDAIYSFTLKPTFGGVYHEVHKDDKKAIDTWKASRPQAVPQIFRERQRIDIQIGGHELSSSDGSGVDRTCTVSGTKFDVNWNN